MKLSTVRSQLYTTLHQAAHQVAYQVEYSALDQIRKEYVILIEQTFCH